MGQYKVPQNVEAEDKIIGPLTLKQFIYTVIGVVIGIVSFLTLRQTPIVMLLVGLPPTALFLLLGLYQRQDQPFEALFLSLVSFLVKPRRRMWIKEPIEEVFKIEAPPVVKTVTQRDPHEVRGQLEQLSQVVDTRGWGSKKAELQEPRDDMPLAGEGRLVEPSLPEAGEPIETDVAMADDILDFQNNPNAQNIGNLIQNQTQAIRQQALASVRSTPSADRNTQTAATDQPPTDSGPRTADNVVNVGSGELTTDAVPLPGSTYNPQTADRKTPTAGAPAATQQIQNPGQTDSGQRFADSESNPLDGILKLAMDNDDLPVSQVAAQANRQQRPLAEGQSVSLRNNGKS